VFMHGMGVQEGEGSARQLLRDRTHDLFR